MRIQVCSANLKHEEHCLHFEKLSIVEDQRWVGDRSCDGAFGKLIFVCFICFMLRSKRKHQQKRLYRQLGSFVSNARNPSTPTHGQWRRKPVHDESLNPIYNLILLYQIKTQPSVGQAARHQEKQRRSCAVHMQSGCGLRRVVGWKRV